MYLKLKTILLFEVHKTSFWNILRMNYTTQNLVQYSQLIWHLHDFKLNNWWALYHHNRRSEYKRILASKSFTAVYSSADIQVGPYPMRLFDPVKLSWRFFHLQTFLLRIQRQNVSSGHIIYVCEARRWFTVIFYFANLKNCHYTLGWQFGLIANASNMIPFWQNRWREHQYPTTTIIPSYAIFIETTTRLMRVAAKELRGCLIINLFTPVDRFISPVFIPWTRSERNVWVFLWWISKFL